MARNESKWSEREGESMRSYPPNSSSNSSPNSKSSSNQNEIQKKRQRDLNLMHEKANVDLENPMIKRLRNSEEKLVEKLCDFWRNDHNAVLMDELERVNKTILFISSIINEIGKPILIVTSEKLLSLWESEFRILIPNLNTVTYTGTKTVRELIQDVKFYDQGCFVKFQVLISHPDVILEDFQIIESVEWEAVIIDECKNFEISKTIKKLNLSTNFRLLLLNSPLKDNISDYVNILSCIDPNYTDITASIDILKERLKNHVINFDMKHNTSKFTEFWVPVLLSNVQLEIYCETLISNSKSLLNLNGELALRDVIISLLKSIDHPDIVDQTWRNKLKKNKPSNENLKMNVLSSGKLVILEKILEEIQKNQLSVLLVFQSQIGSAKNQIGELLNNFLTQKFGRNSYENVDLSFPISQYLIEITKSSGRFIFLLDSHVNLPRVNLSLVNTVIIFNSSLDPLTDIKNLEKFFFLSKETKPVFRLYYSKTVEEKKLIFAKKNMLIDGNSQGVEPSFYHSLLSWGVNNIFNTVDKTRVCDDSYFFLNEDMEFFDEVAREILSELLHKNNGKKERSFLVETQLSGSIYSQNTGNLEGEKDELVHALNGSPIIFWRNLLKGHDPFVRVYLIEEEFARREKVILQRMKMNKLHIESYKEKEKLKNRFFAKNLGFERKMREFDEHVKLQHQRLEQFYIGVRNLERQKKEKLIEKANLGDFDQSIVNMHYDCGNFSVQEFCWDGICEVKIEKITYEEMNCNINEKMRNETGNDEMRIDKTGNKITGIEETRNAPVREANEELTSQHDRNDYICFSSNEKEANRREMANKDVVNENEETMRIDTEMVEMQIVQMTSNSEPINGENVTDLSVNNEETVVNEGSINGVVIEEMIIQGEKGDGDILPDAPINEKAAATSAQEENKTVNNQQLTSEGKVGNEDLYSQSEPTEINLVKETINGPQIINMDLQNENSINEKMVETEMEAPVVVSQTNTETPNLCSDSEEINNNHEEIVIEKAVNQEIATEKTVNNEETVKNKEMLNREAVIDGDISADVIINQVTHASSSIQLSELSVPQIPIPRANHNAPPVSPNPNPKSNSSTSQINSPAGATSAPNPQSDSCVLTDPIMTQPSFETLNPNNVTAGATSAPNPQSDSSVLTNPIMTQPPFQTLNPNVTAGATSDPNQQSYSAGFNNPIFQSFQTQINMPAGATSALNQQSDPIFQPFEAQINTPAGATSALNQQSGPIFQPFETQINMPAGATSAPNQQYEKAQFRDPILPPFKTEVPLDFSEFFAQWMINPQAVQNECMRLVQYNALLDKNYQHKKMSLKEQLEKKAMPLRNKYEDSNRKTQMEYQEQKTLFCEISQKLRLNQALADQYHAQFMRQKGVFAYNSFPSLSQGFWTYTNGLCPIVPMQQNLQNQTSQQQNLQNPTSHQQNLQNQTNQQQNLQNQTSQEKNLQNQTSQQQNLQNPTNYQQNLKNPTSQQQTLKNQTSQQQNLRLSNFTPQGLVPKLPYRQESPGQHKILRPLLYKQSSNIGASTGEDFCPPVLEPSFQGTNKVPVPTNQHQTSQPLTKQTFPLTNSSFPSPIVAQKTGFCPLVPTQQNLLNPKNQRENFRPFISQVGRSTGEVQSHPSCLSQGTNQTPVQKPLQKTLQPEQKLTQSATQKPPPVSSSPVQTLNSTVNPNSTNSSSNRSFFRPPVQTLNSTGDNHSTLNSSFSPPVQTLNSTVNPNSTHSSSSNRSSLSPPVCPSTGGLHSNTSSLNHTNIQSSFIPSICDAMLRRPAPHLARAQNADVARVNIAPVLPAQRGNSNADVASKNRGPVLPAQQGSSNADVARKNRAPVSPAQQGNLNADVASVNRANVSPAQQGNSNADVACVNRANVLPAQRGNSYADVARKNRAPVSPAQRRNS